MTACFPDAFVDVLDKKCPPDNVHTLVIWTKNPANLFEHQQLNSKIREYDQLFVHLTVTGMGGSLFEPNVPSPNVVLTWLPALVSLVESPERIRFRFDPIVHFTTKQYSDYTNRDWFERIAPVIARVDIYNVSTSWISPYKKVVNRLGKLGVELKHQTELDLQNDLWSS